MRTLRGKGMPRLRSNGRVDGHGDLMVHVDVVVPTKLDREQTELLRKLAALRGEEQPDLAGQPQRRTACSPGCATASAEAGSRLVSTRPCSCSTRSRPATTPCWTGPRAGTPPP